MAKAKKAAKTAKKKNNRGNWSTKPVIPLSFINTEKLQKGGDYVKVAKSGIYFGPTVASQLGIDPKNSFLLVAIQDGVMYVSNKPKGLFGGHKIIQSSKNSDRVWAAIPASKYKLKIGVYTLGKAVRTSLLDHNNKEVRFEAYPLISL